MTVGAREVLQSDLARQPLHKQLFSWLSYGLVRAMVGITGYGPKHWQAEEETPGTTLTE
jgi:cardiolipin synthase